MKVTNPGSGPLYATVNDTHYEILAGKSVDAPEADAMELAEYGAIVDRNALDEALAEVVFSPFAEHGPGTDDKGNVVDPEAAAAFAEAVQGDTSKTPGKVADLSVSGSSVAEPVSELVSSEAGVVDEAATADAAADAAADKAAKATPRKAQG